jgi:ABC-2 type transport system ATP-binding protein
MAIGEAWQGVTGSRQAITARGLTKSFGALEVLRGVDLDVAAGDVFALLGPNGAGKTTIVRILATLLRPDAGTAAVAGFDVVSDVHRVRRAISLTGQSSAVDELQTGEEMLRMMGRLWGLSTEAARRRAAELLEGFGLVDAGRRRVGTYSGGMRRRLDLAVSLVGEPAVIFLDEPTTGLDLPSRQAMWSVVHGLAQRGITIFVTTQYLEEADQLASQVAVIDGGTIVAEGTPGTLKARVGTERLLIFLADRTAYDDGVRLLHLHGPVTDQGRLSIEVETDGTAASVRALLDAIDPDRNKVTSFEVRRPTLDDVFLSYTGQATRAARR